MKFTIGDKVKIVSTSDPLKSKHLGRIGRIISVDDITIITVPKYLVDFGYEPRFFYENELGFVNELPIPSVHVNCLCSRSDFERDNKPKIKRVIFNDPATIIMWTDGTKSVVKCQNGEPFDAEKGFVLAYLKKLLGNKNEFNTEIHKWVTDNVGEITTE